MKGKPVEDLGPDVFRTGQIHLKRNPKVRVPTAVSRERDLAFNYTKSLTEYHFGDPLPWRSALAKKNSA